MESSLYTQDISFKEPQQPRCEICLYLSCTSLTKDKYLICDVESVSDQQKRPIKHLEQDQEILKQLESHRPAKSVYLQQPAAERTDVLYEFVSVTQ